MSHDDHTSLAADLCTENGHFTSGIVVFSSSRKPLYMHLYDGGPIDNLGVQAITEYLNRNVLGTSLKRLFPNGCVIVIVDATPASEHPELNTQESSRSFVDYFVDTNALDASDAMLLESRRSLLAGMGIPIPRQDQEMRGRLPVNDRDQCGCEVRHISLRHLMAGEVRYVGRLLVEVPQRVSRGKEYRFTVENGREKTLTKIAEQHPDLAKQAVDVPMRPREEPTP